MNAISYYQKDKDNGVRRVVVRMPASLCDRITERAKQMKTTRIGLIKQAAEFYLDQAK